MTPNPAAETCRTILAEVLGTLSSALANPHVPAGAVLDLLERTTREARLIDGLDEGPDRAEEIPLMLRARDDVHRSPAAWLTPAFIPPPFPDGYAHAAHGTWRPGERCRSIRRLDHLSRERAHAYCSQLYLVDVGRLGESGAAVRRDFRHPLSLGHAEQSRWSLANG